MGSYQSVFTPSCLEGLFPAEERTAAFFDALFGDAEDGAYDIRLTFQRAREGAAEHLEFSLSCISAAACVWPAT